MNTGWAALSAAFVLLLGSSPRQAFAAANFVYHEQTTRDAIEGAPVTSCTNAQPYMATVSPGPDAPAQLHFFVQFHGDADQARVYYTTNGAPPVGSLGVGDANTHVVVASLSCTATDAGNVTDIYGVAIPAQPAGTVVKYRMSAWLSSENVEIFANSGVCSGCPTFTNSAQAILFQYTSAGPPTITSQPKSRTNQVGTAAIFSVIALGGPLTYQWYFNSTNALANATNATVALSNVQATNAGGYQVVVANTYGASTSAVAVLTVLSPPFITQQPASLVVTQGATAAFTVSVGGEPPLSYQWYAGTSVLNQETNSALTFPNAQPSQAGNYSVIITNLYGATTSQVASLTVRVPPSISQQPVGGMTSPGGTFTFTVSAAGDAPLSYQWYFNGTNALSQATNASLALSNVQPSQSGDYTVLVSNNVGSVTSIVATLKVGNSPVILSQPASLIVTQGVTATFSVAVSGDAPLSYQWSLGGTALNQATNSSLNLTNVQASQAGNYSVLITNLAGSITSQVATLTVRVPPSILQQPASLTVTQGTTATFSVSANGDAPLTYQWFFGSTPVGQATNTSLVITNAQVANEGSYTVLVSNLVGTATSSPAVLTILGPARITAQPSSQVVFVGANYTFSVSATGTAPLSYQWRLNGTNLSGKTAATLPLSNIQTNDAGGYSVVVSNAAASVTSFQATLVVRTTNDSVYTAPDGGWSYLYTGNAAAASVTSGLDGTWNRQNGDDSWSGDLRGAGNGLPGGVQATNGILTIEDAVVSGTGSTDNRRFYLTHNLAQESSVTNATTLLSDGVTLSFRARLTPPAPADPLTELTNAPNGFVNINDGKGMFGIRQAGSSGMLISFSLNQAVEDLSTNTSFNFGQAGLHMNNLNGDSRSPNVDPGEGGLTNLLALDPTVFHEFWINIQDNGPAPGTHKISIYLDGSKTPAVFNVTAGTGSDVPSTNYLALGLPSTPQVGAFDLDFLAYKPGVIFPAGFADPIGISSQPTNQLVPVGQPAIFVVGVTGAPPYSFQWFKNGAAISQATNSSYTTPPATNSDAGASFTVVVANIFNSVTSSPALLNLLGPPIVSAQPQSLIVTNGDPASFSVTTQSAVPPTYHWRFNGANLPNETNSSLLIAASQPSQGGNYDVIISNNGGSVTSVVAVLTVYTLDYGDAPAPYPTLLVNNGARHVIVPGIFLGTTVDLELDGQPNANATGDDLAGVADEDGVQFLNSLFAGRTGTVQVVASTNGLLDAWIDFNGDGSWAEAGDQIFASQPLVPGTNVLNFLVPGTANAPASFARFRFSTAGGLSFNGPAANGEAEDYAVSVLPATDLAVSMSAPSLAPLNSNLVFTVTVLNAGPSAATGVALNTLLPGGVSFVSASASQGSCSLSGGSVNCPLGSLNANNSALVTITVVPGSTGTITNQASVTGNETDFVLSNNSASAVTTIEIAPAITTQPVSLTITQGTAFTLSVSATGTAPLRYQWRRAGLDLSGQTNSSFSVSNAQVPDSGAYTVLVSNRVGQALSSVATVTVLAPPVITAQPQSQTNLAGGTALLSVTATGSAPLVYQWIYNTTNSLAGATNAVLTLTNVQKSQAGDYKVSVQNSAGVVTSQPATLTILEMDFGDAPDPSYPTLLAHDGARHRIVPGFYLGARVDFEPDGQPNANATGDDASPSGPNSDEDGVLLLSPMFAGQSASFSVVASSNGFLNAWIDFNANGSWADAGDQVFTNRALVAGSNFLSFAVPASVTAVSSFARFRFSTATNLSFTGEAPDGEVEDYAVAFNAAIDLAILAGAQPNPVAVGTNLVFSLIVSNSGPSAASGVTLNDLLPDTASFVSVSTTMGACGNSAGTVNCSIGTLPPRSSATVTITCLPSAAGTLTNRASISAVEHEVTLANNTSALIVVCQDYPAILAQPQSMTVTNGGTASFTVTASGTALNYQWRLNGGNIGGATNSSLTLTSVQPGQAGNYTVLVSNGVGAVPSDPVSLTVLVPPQITTQPQSQTVLAGSTVQFSVSVSGTAPFQYQWRFNGMDLPGETNPTLNINNVQPSQAGPYTVFVNNSAGAPALSAPATLTVLVPPNITQQPQSATVNAGSQVSLTVLAGGTDPLAYQWYSGVATLLGGATNATLTFSNAQQNQSGSYYVVITNIAGATTSLVATLTVREMDFGDAPDALGYPTLMIFNGARHRIVPGIRLGLNEDFEPDGQPNGTATGDDLSGVNDDDGVLFTSPLRVGQTATVDVVASTNGFLDAWLDFNRNGNWSEPGEQIFTSLPLSTGTNHLSFAVPASAVASNTFARFRFSTAGNLSFDGPAQDGEVEDYQVLISPVIDLAVSLAGSPDPVVTGSNINYSITVTNGGPSAATGVTVTNALPGGVAFISASASQGLCANSGGFVTCQLGPLPAGAQAIVTVVATANRSGLLTNQVSVSAQELDLHLANNSAVLVTTGVGLAPPFTNPNLITVPDVSPASTYPSTILVSGLTSAVYKVTATLSNLSHTFPGDFDILLVGPGGQSVILMSDAGSAPIDGVTLIFDDDSPLVLPETGRIGSETFKPTNYGTNADVFPAPAPPPPYGGQLAGFRGTDPNGLWALYVVDDQLQDSGFIADGWSLTISTLNPIADLRVTTVQTPDPVMVGSNFLYTVTVSNQGPAAATGVSMTNVLPSGLNLGSFSSSQGSCGNTSGVITCALGSLAAGATATLTLTVTSPVAMLLTNLATAGAIETDLNLTNNRAITISSVRLATDLALSGSSSPDLKQLFQAMTYTLVVTNRGANLAASVNLQDALPDGFSLTSAVSSQGNCSNASGILLCDLGGLPIGGSATVTINGTPSRTGSLTNTAVITSYEFDLNPADNVLSQVSSVVVVSQPFSGSGALSIPNLGAATPYPSTLFVSGLTASVYQVTVTLSNLSHPFPDDLDVLLVGPGGQKTLLMSDAGGSLAISNVTLTFSDTAVSALPDSGQILSGTFKPSDFAPSTDTFPAPAPPGPYEARLSVFNNSDANGLWSLYVMSDQSHSAGTLGGWSLVFATLDPIADLGVAVTESPDPVPIGNNITYTVLVTNSGPATATSVSVSDPLPAQTTFLSAISSQGSCAAQNGTVTCALGSIAPGANAVITITAQATQAGLATNTAVVNALERDLNPANNTMSLTSAVEIPPTILVQPASQTRTNNDSVTFTVTAAGTAPFLYQWQHNGIPLSGTTNSTLVLSNLTLTDAGTYRVSVSNRVGGVVSSAAALTILSRPVISAITDRAIDEDTGLTVSFTVGDLETSAAALVVTAASSNPVLVPPANLLPGGSGTNRTLAIRPATNQFGTTTITVTVRDSDGIPASSSFVLTVRSVNDLPTISSIADQTVREDISTATVAFTVSDVETPAGSLVVTGHSSNPALIPDSNIVLDGSGSNRTLVLTPAANAFGSAFITLTVTDGDGGSAGTAFGFTVISVNDPPTLDALNNLSLPLNASTQLVVLSGITSGAANEHDTLTVTALSSNTALIPNPIVSYTSPNGFGTLQFVPQANTSGVAVITVTVNDGQASNNIISRNFSVTVAAPPHFPTVSAIPDQIINENTATGPLSFTASDPGTPAGNLALTGSSSNPALVPAPNIVFGGSGSNRTVTVTPVSNQTGIAAITLNATNGAGGSGSSTFLLTVNFINQPPTLQPISDLSLNEDAGPQTVPLTGISPGATNENQTLIITATSGNPLLIPNPAINYNSPNPSGSLLLAPIKEASGTALITVTISDGQATNSSVTRTFNVVVASVNDPPTLNPLPDLALNEDAGSQIVALSGIGSGASNEVQTLVVTAASSNPVLIPNPVVNYTNGTSTGVLTFAPLPDANGAALITITVNDGGASNNITTRSFNVTVNAINDPPTIGPIANQSVLEDTLVGPISLAVGDVDTPLAALVFSATSSNPALVPASNITFGVAGTNRTLAILPATNQSGTATITIKVSDGQASATSSFGLTVTATNDPPIISSVPDQITDEDTVISIAFAVSDAESAASNLTVTAFSSNPALVPATNVLVGGTGSLRSVTLIPLTNQFGATTITLTASDGTATSSNSFLLTVAPVNDLPTLGVLTNLTIAENASQLVALSGISSGATNEADTLTVTASSSNPALIPNPTVSYTINNSTGTLAFTAAPGVTGTAIISVTVNDGKATNNFVTRTFSVTVTPATGPPFISAIADQAMNEDTTLTIPFTIRDAETPPFRLVVTGASTNTLLLANTNIFFDGNGTNRTVTLLPTANLFGATRITLTLSDGTTTATSAFNLTVNAVNDPPTLDPMPDLTGSISSGNTKITIPLSGITSGATNEADFITVTAVSSNTGLIPNPTVSYSSPSTGGSISYRQANGVSGTATITVTVNDGQATNNSFSRTFVVHINASGNAAPTLSAIANQTTAEDTPTAAIPFTIGDDATPVSVLSLAAQSSNPLLAPVSNIVFGGSGSSRTVTVTPAANQFGTATITISVSDTNFGFTSTSFLLTINSVNDAPTISAIPNQTVMQNSSAGPISFVVGDVETTAGNLTVSAVSSNPTLVANTNIVFGGSGANRALQITPRTNQIGTATITVTVSDGASNASSSFVLTATPFNNPPTLSSIAAQSINEDTSTPALAFTISDVETPAASLVLSGVSSNPALVPNTNILFGGSGSNRTVTVTPTANSFGTAAITLEVDDSDGGSASATFLLTVTPINDPPTLDLIADIVTNDGAGPQSLTLTGLSPGPGENQSLALAAISGNPALLPNPTINYSAGPTATLVYTPVLGIIGTASITVTASDGQPQNGSVSRTFNITVNPLPRISVIADQSVMEDTTSSAIAFAVSDALTPAANLVLSANSSNPALVPNANILFGISGTNRTVTLTPAPDQFGSALITISVANTNDNTASSVFLFTVNPVNDPPTLNVLGNLALNEDAGLQTVQLSGIGSGAGNEAQNLTVTATSSNPALIPNPVVNYTSPASTGSVTFASAPDASGTAVITVLVNDGQPSNNIISRTFTVTVNPVNDAPFISDIVNQVTTQNRSAGPVPFTIGDVESAASTLTLSGTSSNPALVPNQNITFGGSGSNRTVSVLPTTNQSGSATITVTVSDGTNNTSDTFVLTVQAVNNPPAISSITDQTNNEDVVVGPISFTVSDLETPAAALILTGDSSAPNLLPVSGILFGGSGTNRTVTLVPATNEFGTAMITLSVVDTNGGIAITRFKLVLNPVNDAPTIDPIGNLLINENAGVQYRALSGISSGAANENQSLTLTVSNSNPSLITGVALSYLSPGTTALLTFRPVTNLTGNATLTVTANDGGASNNISTRSFTVSVVSFNTPPVISTLSDLTLNEDTISALIPFTVSDAESSAASLSVSAASSNPALLPVANISLGGSGASRTVQLVPAPNQFGTAIITLTVSDGNASSGSSFALNVNPVNDPPTLNPLGSLTIPQNSGQQTVTLSGISAGPANEIQHLTITATSSNPALIPTPAVLYNSPDAAGTLTFTPAANTNGTALITVTVRDDGGTLNGGQDTFAQTLLVTVFPAGTPVLQIARSGPTNQLSFATQTGKSYVLEYKNALADPAWTSTAPIPGTGGVVVLIDVPGPATNRFYRVRVP